MANKGYRYRYVNSYSDMKKIYDIASSFSYCTLQKEDYKFQPGTAPLRERTIVQDTPKYYKITTMYVKDVVDSNGAISYEFSWDKYVCTWIFDKSGDNKTRIHPSKVSRLSNNVYKPNKIADDFERDENGKIIQSAKPTIGFNKKFDKTEHHVVCYDLNSAYAKVLTEKIIDTYKPDFYREVRKDEVGFLNDDKLTLVHKGFADVVFPLIESPYKDFARHYYNQKKTAPKGSEERDLAKQILVITVGLWQNVNPYLRAYVVNSCNEFIDNLRKKYSSKVCMWNTDAIYTTEHIPELDSLCGNDIGQFKVEYEGLFRQSGMNYQKVEEHKTTYRGIVNSTINKDYNILEGNLKPQPFPYRMNKETLGIEEAI